MVKVLIVDDHPDSAAVLARLLRAKGFDPRVTTDSASALDALREYHPDAILLDVMMPGMSGLEVLREVKNNPATSDVAVVMFSAVSKPEVITQAYHQGASDYWIKASLDFGQMMARLQNVLPKKTVVN